MSRPHVTITLGSSGQKVVKRPWPNSDNFAGDAPKLSGSKRIPAHRNVEDYLFSTNKRLQGDTIPRSSRYSGRSDARISGNDLRLKLLRKRLDKRMKLEEQKKIELRDKMPRTIQSSKGPEGSLLRNFLPSRGAGESLQMESLRSSYNSPYMDRLRPKSPDSIHKISGGMSSSRSVDEMFRLPPARPFDASRTDYMMRADLLDSSHTKGSASPTVMTSSMRNSLDICKPVKEVPPARPVDASRNDYMMRADLLDPSHPKGSASMSVMTSGMRTNLDIYKPIKEFPPASSSMLRIAYPEEPVTVSSLLHSLGLGKYAIHFQAEEIDMAALKQMGDRDLKELGIPMGPRKKILLAMLGRSKRPTV